MGALRSSRSSENIRVRQEISTQIKSVRLAAAPRLFVLLAVATLPTLPPRLLSIPEGGQSGHLPAAPFSQKRCCAVVIAAKFLAQLANHVPEHVGEGLVQLAAVIDLGLAKTTVEIVLEMASGGPPN